MKFENILPEECQLVTGLKPDDDLHHYYNLDIALEKFVQSVQKVNYFIDVGANNVNKFDFTGDLNIIGYDGECIARNTSTIVNEAKSIGCL